METMTTTGNDQPDQRSKAQVRRPGHGTLRVILGALLLAIGLDRLLEELIGYDLSVFPLVVGIGLLALWWSNTSAFGYLIAGSIVTGLGAGLLLEDLTGVDGVVLLGLASGFVFLASSSERAQWAWWPAAVLGVIGTLRAAGDLTDLLLFAPSVARIGAPIVAIALGLVLLARPKLSRSVFVVLSAVLLVVGILMVVSLDGPLDGPLLRP